MSWKLNITAVKLKQPSESGQVAATLGFSDDTGEQYQHQEIKMVGGGELAIASLNDYHILVNFDLCENLVYGSYSEFESLEAEEVIGGFIYHDRSGFFAYRNGELVRRYYENDHEGEVETQGEPLSFEAETTWKRAHLRAGLDASESSDIFSLYEALFELLREPLGGYYDESTAAFHDLEFQVFEEPFDENDLAAQRRSWFRASALSKK